MKFRLLRDILIYIVIPILLFNILITKNIQLAFQISCSLAIIYSIFTKVKENRINTTGVFIFSIIALYMLSNISKDSDNIYFMNTCICLGISLIIPSSKVFNKDISIVVIKDILRASNKNTLAVVRLMRKKSMMGEIQKILAMIEMNFILISLLRISKALMYNRQSGLYLNFITNCIGMIFTIVIMYKIINVVRESKKLNINNKSSKDEGSVKGKVINFNYYK